MAIQIKLKNSVVQDSTPSTSDLPAVGELALNANINSIGGFMRASNNTIVKIFGPGSVTTPTATTTVSGISELATNSETTTGTATNRVVTPAGLNAVTVAERATSNTNYVAKAGSTLTGVLTMPNGSNSAPAINFGDSDSGIFGGTNTVSLAAGGTTRLTADTGVDITGTLAVTGAITSTSDLTIADKIIHAGDTNTAVRFPAADTVSVETGGSEKLRVDSSGRLLVGTSSARTNLKDVAANNVTPSFLFEKANDDAIKDLAIIYGRGNLTGPNLLLGKHRATTIGGTTIVQDNDELGGVGFLGSDGTTFRVAASVRSFCDGTPGASDMPGRLVFGTTADGAVSPTTRLTIDSGGTSTFTGDIATTGTLSTSNATITSTAPFITFNDSNSESDFQIINQSGNFQIRDIDQSNRLGFQMGSDGNTLIGGNCTVGGKLFLQERIAEHTGDSDTFIIFPTTDAFAVQTGGTERFRVSDHVDVIGNLDVSAGLDVTGAITASTSITASGNLTTNGNFTVSGTNPNIFLTDTNNDSDYRISNSNGVLEFRDITNTTNRLEITSDGKVNFGSVARVEADGTFKAPHGSAATPAYNFLNDNDNGMFRATTNSIGFSTAGTERMRVDSGGRLLHGVTSSIDVCSVAPSRLQVHNNASVLSASFTGYGAHAGGSIIALGKSRSNTIGDATGAVQSGDTLGDIRFGGSDGTDMETTACAIRGEVDGSVSSNTIPGRLEFSTNGTERLRIDSSGNVTVKTDDVAFSGAGTLRINSGSTFGALNLDGGSTNRGGEINLTGGSNGGQIQFRTGIGTGQQSEKMRLDSSGRLLIGTTTEGFGTFGEDLTLASTGDTGITIRSGTTHRGSIYFSDGTSGAAEYQGYIQYNHDDGRLVFGTTASERIRIDASGFVGIGNTSPSSAHGGARNLVIGTNSGDNGMTIISGSSGVGHIEFSDGTSTAATRTAGGIRYYHDSNYMRFNTNGGTERMRIRDGGEVAIGGSGYSGQPFSVQTSTTNLGYMQSTGTTRAVMNFVDGNSTQNVGFGAIGNNHVFMKDGNEKMRITVGGDVGIGTSSPDQKLHVHKGSAGSIASSANSVLTLENDNDSILQFLSPNNKVAQLRFGDPQDNGAGYIDYNHGNNALTFGTAGPEKMRLNSTGTLLIGASSYSGGGSAPTLYVSGTTGRNVKIHGGSATASLQLTNSTTGEGEDAGFQIAQSGNTAILANAEAQVVLIQNQQSVQTSTVLRVSKPQAASNVQSHMIHFIVSSHERGAIVAGSSFGSSPSFSSISDYRVKTNIRNYTDGWNNIKALPVKLFDINKEGEEATDIKGWIAHEVQAVIPEAVTGTKDAKNEDGSDEYQSLGYGMFMPDVVSALQTAIAKIEILESKVAALEAA